MRRAVLCVAVMLSASSALAECEKKTGYSLFNPTPAECMRDLSTDRPDVTESPYSVPAGHIQVEMDLFNLTRDKSNGAETESTDFGALNFKLGLSDSSDIQFIFNPYTVEYNRATKEEARSRVAGSGDLIIRYKHNIWGNDDGATALALMPFITVPTSQRDLGADGVQGGLIVPFGLTLSDSTVLGLMAEVDYFEDGDRDGHHLEFLGTVTVGQSITEAIGLFVEMVTISSEEPDTQWVGVGNAGFTYGITNDVQFDGGVGLGLNRAADDLRVFTGLTIRN